MTKKTNRTISQRFRPIPNFPLYLISPMGHIWNMRRKKRRIPKAAGYVTATGYVTIALCRGKERILFRLHRLVLEAFVGACPPGMECRHLDGNPSNNCLSNLKWGTNFENMQDKIKHGRNRGWDRPMLNISFVEYCERFFC